MKRKLTLTLIFATVLIGIAAGFKACESAIERVLDIPNGAVLTNYKGDQTTPAGARVRYGLDKLSSEQLAAVDAGLKRASDNSVLSGYPQDRRSGPPAFYTVQTPPYKCQLSPEQRIPSFLLHANDYDGSIYDQYNPKGKGVRDGQGVVYAAEMVLSLGTPGSQPAYGWMYVCPDLPSLIEAVNNGREHIEAANNDPAYFYETQYHFVRGHPILPHIQSKGLAGEKAELPVTIVESVESFAGGGPMVRVPKNAVIRLVR